VQQLAEVPDFGIDSAQQIIAEVGVTAATFPSPERLDSGWAPALAMRRVCGREVRSPSARKATARCDAPSIRPANAAVQAKGTIFAIVYRRLVPRLGQAQDIGADWLCRLIWKAFGSARSQGQRTACGTFGEFLSVP
jgi:hypothetical protein